MNMLPSLRLSTLLQLTDASSQQVTVALALCGAVCIIAAYRSLNMLRTRSKIPKGLKLPPGPPGRFFVGNLFDLPTKENWKSFQRWAETYGDFTYFNLFGTSLLFVNSPELQNELFEKRGAKYSERFQSTMLHDLSGFDWSVVTLQYGDMWRRHRTVLHNTLNKTAFVQHHGTVERHVRALLIRLHESPEKFLEHIRRMLGTFTLKMTYGYNVKRGTDQHIEAAESALRLIGEVSQPGAFYVDIFPILKYVPSWFPGAGFKHTARRLNQNLQDMKIPFNDVKELMKTGNAPPSLVSSSLEDLQTRTDIIDYDEEEEVLRSISSIIYLGGIDTTDSTFQSFLLAMILYPEVQRAAQRELDTVIGLKSLPTFEDRDNLPYINALVKETLRWHPITPCAFPHLLKEDDVISNYFIPKGTIVMGNTWAVLHSPSYGEDVDDFNPSRFMKGNADVRDPDVTFGYGRRVCPGKWMADSQLFLLIASMLHIYNIEPHESEIPTKDDFVSGIVSHPKPFKCHIRPRNSEAVALLEHISHEFS